MGPYRIKRRVGELAYELELPASTHIHPVISCIHLEQFEPDSFKRMIPPPAPILVEGEEEFVVERLVGQRNSSRGPEIQVKWKGYDELTWEPRRNLLEDVPDLVRKFDKRLTKGRSSGKR